jgi:hypothetical protein
VTEEIAPSVAEILNLQTSNQSANTYHSGSYDIHARQVLISSPSFSNHPALNPVHHQENQFMNEVD